MAANWFLGPRYCTPAIPVYWTNKRPAQVRVGEDLGGSGAAAEVRCNAQFAREPARSIDFDVAENHLLRQLLARLEVLQADSAVELVLVVVGDGSFFSQLAGGRDQVRLVLPGGRAGGALGLAVGGGRSQREHESQGLREFPHRGRGSNQITELL